VATARIQLRRDTASAWTTANTVLNPGELGLETDTSKIKVGDGSKSWQNLDYIVYDPAFSDLTSTPTTIAGYGITDAFDGAFNSLTGKPTTVAGYGITDALTSVSFAQVTGKPTTVAGYGITDALTSVTFGIIQNRPTTIAGYGITDAFDGAFSSLTGRPTTISGYGITDAFDGAFSSLTGKPTTISGYGITDAFDGAFSSLTGKPTTLAGYTITDAAPLASPALTGTPTAPTAASGTNSTQIATTAFVNTALTPYAEIDATAKLYFQENAPTILALAEVWLDTNAGAFYKAVAGSSTVPLDSSLVSASSSSVTIPAAGASDTRLELSAGTPSGSITFSIPVFLEAFSSTGSNAPTLGTLTYHDNTTATVNSIAISRATGNALDKKVKTFTYFSGGISNSNVSHMTITVSGKPEWQVQESHVQSKVDAVIDSAPGALDTLNELAAALGDDANFSTTLTNNLATKAPLASPSLTGTPTAPTASAGSNTTQLANTAFVTGAIANKIALTDLSVTQNSASGTGALSYNNSTGVFSYTPPATVTFANISGKPTTVSGYGITDALTTGADADIGSNDFITTGKAYFANVFSNTSNLPNATTYHGMFAHVHATGAGYFAHAGSWVRLANHSDLFSGSFTALSNKPTTIAGYGITDAFDGAFSSLTGRPTTISGYGITDAAPLASPTFTGTPAGPTATSGTNTTQLATTAFVQAAISGFSAGANVSVSTSAPSSPAAGDLWFDSSELILYVYYADGTSNQWVQTNPSSIQTGGFDGAFSSLTGKPTTISGYGITDAASTNSPSFTGTPSAPTASSGTNTGQLATTAFVQQEISSAGGYNDANVDTHLNRSTAATGEVLSWNGSDYDWVAQPTIPAQEFIKAYRFDGTLSTNTGTKRLYLQKAYTLKSIHAYVDTASAGASINITVNKNGSSLQTLSIAAGATVSSVTSLSHSIVANNYLTIDITQVGSSTAGENLYLVFTFN